jgi:hypothetical protein
VIHLQVRYSTFKLAGVVMTRKCSSSRTSQVASQDNAGIRQATKNGAGDGNRTHTEKTLRP